MLPAATLPWARQVLGAGTMSVGEIGGGTAGRVYRLELVDNRSVVLKQYDPTQRAASLVATEATALTVVGAAGAVPVPAVLGVDTGELAGAPSLLLDFAPGRVDLTGTESLGLLAEVLVRIHRLPAPGEWPTWSSWAEAETLRVPPWAADPGLYAEAFALARSAPPAYDEVLLHGDFRPGHVLLAGGTVTAVLDWSHACAGPAWLDVAHCCSHLAGLHGAEAAAAFADAYEQAGGAAPGAEARAYWQARDLLGFLPDAQGHESGADAASTETFWTLAGRGDLTADLVRSRREDLLRATLATLA